MRAARVACALADWTEGVRTVPPTRIKAKREHRVPLCRRAIEILDGAWALAGREVAGVHPRGPSERRSQVPRRRGSGDPRGGFATAGREEALRGRQSRLLGAG